MKQKAKIFKLSLKAPYIGLLLIMKPALAVIIMFAASTEYDTRILQYVVHVYKNTVNTSKLLL